MNTPIMATTPWVVGIGDVGLGVRVGRGAHARLVGEEAGALRLGDGLLQGVARLPPTMACGWKA